MIKVKCILKNGFNDIQENKMRVFGEEFKTTKDRAEYLEKANAVEIIEVPKEDTEIKTARTKKKTQRKNIKTKEV